MARPVLRTTARGKQGPRGPQGERGPQGLPATNAAEDDAAIATFASTPGTATHSALADLIGAEVEAGVSEGIEAVASTVEPPAGFPQFTTLPMPTIRRLGGGRFLTDIDYSHLIPPAGETYWVGPGATGSGTSPSDPAKLADAIAKPDVGTIMYLPGEYRRESSALASPLDKSLNHIAAGPGVRITAWNANLTWTNTSGNIYQASRSATQTVVDVANLDDDGNFTTYEKKADLGSIDGPGQWAIDGSTVYVWAIGDTDLSVPSAPGNQLRLGITITGGIPARSGTRQYVKGITFEGHASGGLSVEGGAVIVAEDCAVKYAPGDDGIAMSGAGSGMILVRTDVAAVLGDGASYRGAAAEFIEIDCRIRDCGVVPGATNNNCTTAHAGTRGIRVGGHYSKSGGPVVADVNDAKSWNLGCFAGRSELTNSGSFAAEASGEYSTAEMWLDECEALDSDYAFRTYPGSTAAIHLHATRYGARKGALYPTDTGTVDFYDA